MWSGVDETPLDSSFVYPNDSADFTTGWNSGSGGWDQFNLAAGIKHPTDYPTRLIDLPLPYGSIAPAVVSPSFLQLRIAILTAAWEILP